MGDCNTTVDNSDIVDDCNSTELTSHFVYRDLSKPLGAICSTEAVQRYNNLVEIGEEPYHYPTHYSSAHTVNYYLVRMDPHTEYHRIIQGGKLDHPNRQFHSVGAKWSAITTGTQDVNELIPEFFYFPELCVNRNNLALGRLQSGAMVNDLLLHHGPLILRTNSSQSYAMHWSPPLQVNTCQTGLISYLVLTREDLTQLQM